MQATTPSPYAVMERFNMRHAYAATISQIADALRSVFTSQVFTLPLVNRFRRLQPTQVDMAGEAHYQRLMKDVAMDREAHFKQACYASLT